MRMFFLLTCPFTLPNNTEQFKGAQLQSVSLMRAQLFTQSTNTWCLKYNKITKHTRTPPVS